jgi:methanogenic corrinoid protein MtbC1
MDQHVGRDQGAAGLRLPAAGDAAPDRVAMERAAAQVEDGAAAGADWVALILAARHGEIPDRGGIKARFQARSDQFYHIQILAVTLATGESGYFTEYVRWLATALASRGVPATTLNESFLLIRTYYQSQLALAEFAQVAAVLEAGLAVIAERGQTAAERALVSVPEIEDLVRILVSGDQATALAVARAAIEGGRTYVQVATRLFQPALYRVGELWQQNTITVAAEHLATEISRSVLARLFMQTTPEPPVIGRRALFAAVEKDNHVLGLQLVAEAFQIAGWSVQYLGASTPTPSLVRQVDSFRPEVAGLSVSLAQQLPALKRTIDALRFELGSQCPTVIVGGRPTNQIEGIWRWTGADGWCPDAERALAEIT